jgi:hypothetical protein
MLSRFDAVPGLKVPPLPISPDGKSLLNCFATGVLGKRSTEESTPLREYAFLLKDD